RADSLRRGERTLARVSPVGPLPGPRAQPPGPAGHGAAGAARAVGPLPHAAGRAHGATRRGGTGSAGADAPAVLRRIDSGRARPAAVVAYGPGDAGTPGGGVEEAPPKGLAAVAPGGPAETAPQGDVAILSVQFSVFSFQF